MNFKFNKISKIILGVVAVMLATITTLLVLTERLSALCLYRLMVLHARLLV